MDAESLWLAHSVDYACLAIAFLLPVAAVLRWNLYGVVFGTLIHWGSLIVAGILISELDLGGRGTFHSFLDLIWFLFGWIEGLVYCFVLYGMKYLGLLLVRFNNGKTEERRIADASPPKSPPAADRPGG